MIVEVEINFAMTSVRVAILMNVLDYFYVQKPPS
jgi:hypothetical protein